jgi:uncharacterized membrane protein YhaH (DUF805 family)
MDEVDVRQLNLAQVLNSRGRRLPFVIGTALSYGVFIGLVTYLLRQDAPIALFLTIRFLGLMILPLQFGLAARRLHDCNQSMIWASPLPFFFLIGMYNNFVTRTLHAPALTLTPVLVHFLPTLPYIGTVLILVVLLYVVLMDLALAIIPGTKGPNRFGPDPRRPMKAADHF